jgi:hypothetical protein
VRLLVHRPIDLEVARISRKLENARRVCAVGRCEQWVRVVVVVVVVVVVGGGGGGGGGVGGGVGGAVGAVAVAVAAVSWRVRAREESKHCV